VQSKLDLINIDVQPVTANWLPQNIMLNVLRLDEVHPVVSGNKWFKLKYYLQQAKQAGCHTIATFGGAYSNHIVATAFACKLCGFSSIGIIRGEEKPATLSHTLLQAAEYGMQLQFVTRQAFNNKENIKGSLPGVYWINEGGYGPPGAKGAAEILHLVKDVEKYSHIVCAVGTGTMFAGLVNNARPGQKIIGISVLKNNFSIIDEAEALLHSTNERPDFCILHGYHFGGYAKYTAPLIDFMKQTWYACGLPTDFVYTAKTLYAIQQLTLNKTIWPGSRVLMIHSGGLQGNASLQKGMLPF
jgi:1-aminocyclopropane-1-carboxylate deaminase/D-cysteine desulfhydrase-like pyridoxal-dependent ACC family enzyme